MPFLKEKPEQFVSGFLINLCEIISNPLKIIYQQTNQRSGSLYAFVKYW
jgi:hypothetical protein